MGIVSGIWQVVRGRPLDGPYMLLGGPYGIPSVYAKHVDAPIPLDSRRVDDVTLSYLYAPLPQCDGVEAVYVLGDYTSRGRLVGIYIDLGVRGRRRW